jgi:hypothetical protein
MICISFMNALRLSALLIFVFAARISALAQPGDERTKVNEFLQQQEQQKKAVLLNQMDSGVYLMENGEFERAEKKFKHVLDNIRGVPSDLTFFFGKNSFYLGKYKQSIDWLNKYIQLKGTNGQYSSEAGDIKKKAEEAFVKEKTVEASKVSDVLSVDYDIDCGPSGKITCPVCKGDHVVIKKGAFGDEYKTCPYCNIHGILTCEEYNKLLRGELKPKN